MCADDEPLLTEADVARWKAMLDRLRRSIRHGPAPRADAAELLITTIAPTPWHHLEVIIYSDRCVDWMCVEFDPEPYFAAWAKAPRVSTLINC